MLKYFIVLIFHNHFTKEENDTQMSDSLTGYETQTRSLEFGHKVLPSPLCPHCSMKIHLSKQSVCPLRVPSRHGQPKAPSAQG